MTAEKTVEKIKEDVQNLVAPKPANVPAQTKPHYWLYKQGKDVWNRWAREAFFDENGKDDGRIDGYIEDAKRKFEEVKKLVNPHSSGTAVSYFLGMHILRIHNLEEFKLLTLLSDDEKAEIENKMKEGYFDWCYSDSSNIQFLNADAIKLPEIKDKIDFYNTGWNEEVDFFRFLFPHIADFSSATFHRYTMFASTTFTNDANFTSATFSSSIDFTTATFSSSVYFTTATFTSDANFISATFSRGGNFRLATFAVHANFTSATFSYSVDFTSTTFSSDAYFDSATFTSYTNFSFDAYFCSATFTSSAYFRSATFNSDAYFSSATFSSDVYFSSATFKYINLHKTNFQDDAVFRKAKFESVPIVSGLKIEGVLDFIDAQWPSRKGSKDPDSDTLNYSQIKRRMQELHLHDHEIFFFRKELLCKAEASKRKSEALRKPREIALESDKSDSGNDGSIKNKKYYKFLDENWRTAQLIYLYDAVCKCGDSVARPVSGLIGLFFMMALIYPFIVNKMNIKEGLYLSGYNTFPFLNPNKSIHDTVIKNLYNIEGITEFSDIVYSLLSGFQTFVSMILIFLIALCLRNYLRIK